GAQRAGPAAADRRGVEVPERGPPGGPGGGRVPRPAPGLGGRARKTPRPRGGGDGPPPRPGRGRGPPAGREQIARAPRCCVPPPGRRDLDVHAGAPQIGIKSPALRLLASRVPVTGAMPVALVSQASGMLSNQLIHARVTGTVRSPTVQILLLRSLQEDVVRFF